MSDVVYTASGMRHKWEVYGNGTKWYVQKRTKAGGKKMGSAQIVASEHTARQIADRRAREEGSLV